MLLTCFSSCCWHFMWVSGSSNTSNPVRTWSVPIWNISEKKEIQRTRAGMYIPQVRPFKGLKFWILVYWSFLVGVYSQMSCHPELNQYIQDTLHCMKPLIEKVIYWPIRGNHITSVTCVSPMSFFSQNDAEKVVVVIMDKEHRPVERFVFEISQPTLLSIRCVFNDYCSSFCVYAVSCSKVHVDVCFCFCCCSSDSLLSHVEQLLRAFILKISVCDAVLNNNPPGNVNRITVVFELYWNNRYECHE